jgi:outer membrane biosynthesis protein TonB
MNRMHDLGPLISIFFFFSCGGQPNGANISTAPSPPHANKPHAGSTRQLSAQEVQHVVSTHRASIRACYDPESWRNPSLSGRVTLQWLVKADGSVDGAHVAQSTLDNSVVESCMVKDVTSWRFPAANGESNITVPFVFSGEAQRDGGA